MSKASKPEDFEDSRTAPLSKIRLTSAQRRILDWVVAYGYLWIDGRQLIAADRLTDWGFITQGRSKHYETGSRYKLEYTARGARYAKKKQKRSRA